MTVYAKRWNTVHPAAADWPRGDVDAIAASIAAVGLQHAGKLRALAEGRFELLDGRTRDAACARLGVAMRWEIVTCTDDEAEQLVLACNKERRHLDASGLADVALARVERYRSAAQQRMFAGVADPSLPVSQGGGGKSASQAAADLGISTSLVESAIRVRREAPALLGLRREGVTYRQLDAIAKAPPERRDKLAEAARQGASAREIGRLSRQIAITGVLTSSESTEWYTPAPIVEVARRVLGAIDLDPASSAAANETVKAARYYTQADDGLQRPWHGRVWLNPPYGRIERAPLPLADVLAEQGKPTPRPYESSQAAWTRRALDAYEAGEIDAAVLLLNAVPDTLWWHDLVFDRARAICFVRGRLEFTRGDGSGETNNGGTHGSALVYVGPHWFAFLQATSAIGFAFATGAGGQTET